MGSLSAVDYLISAQHASGGWGYKTTHRPVVEPTAVALLALRDEPAAQQAFQAGISWLMGCQHQDGGWGINEIDAESGWQTAWALIIMKSTGQDREAISLGENWLASVATYDVTSAAFLSSNFPGNATPRALAWPWLPGQIPWVEPTALALLALQGMSSSALARARLDGGLAYLRTNRTPDGGWWAGNAGPLDTVVIPRAYPTALSLIALAEAARAEILDADLSALQQDLQRDAGMLAQASGLLAMQVLRKDVSGLLSTLLDGQLPDGSWERNPFVSAWALLGLKGAF